MKELAVIFVGGGVGACLRLILSTWIENKVGAHFPWGTLAVNVSGCFVMGLLTALASDTLSIFSSPIVRQFTFVGVLGGFTTFSSFSIQTLNLFDSGDQLSAILYVLASVIICLVAVYLGSLAGFELAKS